MRLVCLLVLACANAQAAAPSPLPLPLPLQLPEDGWVSWDVPTVDAAPAWCCFRDPAGAPARCELDGPNQGFGSQGGARTDTLRVYAQLQGGRLLRARALAPSCQAHAARPVRHLGAQDADASTAWLSRSLPAGTGELENQLLAALALHRGDAALRALAEQTRTNAPLERRKLAVFWLGQVRGEPGVERLKALMLADPSAALREHAAFSLAQSGSPQAPGLLVRQGEGDASPQVRAQAWFWLAQTGFADAETPVLRALQRDADAHVRQQAVFALSQLPAPRAVKALVGVARDARLDREARKQALFWLAQSEAPEATRQLEALLLSESARPGSR